jgi:hypothetical protein
MAASGVDLGAAEDLPEEALLEAAPAEEAAKLQA